MKHNHYLSLLALSAAVFSGNVITAQADETSELAIAAVGDTIEAGSAATLTVEISGGTAPYTIEWLNGKHESVGSSSAESAGDAAVSYTPSECDDYYVTVTDAASSTASDTCRVVVTGDAVVATFENLYLDDESYWCGPDTKGEAITGTWGDSEMSGSFVSGSYQFGNCYSLDWWSWTGFAYSNSTSSDFETYTTDQYNSASGAGYDGSNNFAVAYSEGTISVLNDSENGDSINGFYINNNAYVVNSVTNGDSYAKQFEEGDYFKVIFTGENNGEETGTVEYYLADYQSSTEADRYYLDTWQWVDLRSLGAVTSISFEFESTDMSYGYINTPTYFCVDNFNGEREITVVETQTAGGSIDLSSFFTFESDEATVTYAIADEIADSLTDYVSLSDDGTLTVSTDITGDFDVIISATQRGKIQFIDVPYSISTGISAVSVSGNDDDSTEVARYTVGGQLISEPQQGVNIIRTKDGKTRKVVVK